MEMLEWYARTLHLSTDVNNLLNQYQLNINPFEDDNNIAESSAMGAMNNSGGIPPKIPPKIPWNFGITDPFSDNSENNEGPIRKSYYDTRYDENHNELCPITQDFIEDNGKCEVHGEAPCIDEDPFNVAIPTPSEGYWDPARERFVPLTMRHWVLNRNKVFDPRYVRDWDNVELSGLKWKLQTARAKALLRNRSCSTLTIKDLQLTFTQKQYLRNCMIQDKRSFSYTKTIFANRNIEHYPLTNQVLEYLSVQKKINPFTNELTKKFVTVKAGQKRVNPFIRELAKKIRKQ
jgi:hypothetical protein